MKRVVLVVTGVLLVMVVLFVGCTPKTAPAPVATQTVTGVLGTINTPAEPGPDIVTIQTPEGLKTFPINAYTTYSLGGNACTLDQLEAVTTGNVSYNCTLVMDDEMGLTAIYVTKQE